MRYPVKLTPADEGGFVVTFPDIPEAITQGDDRESALDMAKYALLTSLKFYFEDGRRVLPPSRVEHGQDAIAVPPNVAFKIRIHNGKMTRKALLQRRWSRP